MVSVTGTRTKRPACTMSEAPGGGEPGDFNVVPAQSGGANRGTACVSKKKRLAGVLVHSTPLGGETQLC